jgi:uncharacterized membrane protein YphA (DoxX/SURF4 family)
MKTLTRKLPVAARLLLGLTFLVFGLNGFLHFLPQPAPPPAGGAFFGALYTTGYMLPLLKGTEVLAGALLLAGLFVPLALALLAPVIVNIVAFHLFLAPGNYGVVALVLASEIYLAWTQRAAFAPMLRARPALSAAGPARAGTNVNELRAA